MITKTVGDAGIEPAALRFQSGYVYSLASIPENNKQKQTGGVGGIRTHMGIAPPMIYSHRNIPTVVYSVL